jgi:hypothetical protein
MNNILKYFTIMYLIALLIGGAISLLKSNQEKKYILQVLCDSYKDCVKLQKKEKYRLSTILILSEGYDE